MSKRPRRNHTLAFKAKVSLSAIKGDRWLSQRHCNPRRAALAQNVKTPLAFIPEGRPDCQLIAALLPWVPEGNKRVMRIRLE
jgi:hypothetical protein